MSETQHHGDVLLHLGRLEGKVDALLHSRDRHESELSGLQSAVSDLQHSRSKLLGVCLTLGGVSSIAVQLIQTYLKHT
jgi:hypothetical protein